ncbi:hypothetical protein NDN08_002682 [Rhodosorus marinus]|uniref:Malate dehydrogenase n=1 Tax=Rhodosorus marinus TaxID=101924 RepID=A0AAV8UYP7_9RHOD|nr:hypothetical protein NDN08_002682 [Rhodosorus marinus]
MFDAEPVFPDRPIRVAITGAAGQIGYALLPLICTGRMFGMSQKVSLHLLEITPALTALSGVVMELEDCAFPILDSILATDDPAECFKDVDVAMLVGSFPRKAGMERKELLSKNGAIFHGQGEILEAVASKDVKIVIVGNPANTNALILSYFAKGIPVQNISALTRLDHNRTVGLVAKKLGTSVANVEGVVIWGNHSSTQYPDVSNAKVKGFSQSIVEAMGGVEYLEEAMIPHIQGRGASIIAARKLSSAMSAANAACDHVRDWLLGSNGRIVSMAVHSSGEYDIPKGIWYSFPVQCSRGGKFTIVQGLNVSDFSRARMDATAKELTEEREAALSLYQ